MAQTQGCGGHPTTHSKRKSTIWAGGEAMGLKTGVGGAIGSVNWILTLWACQAEACNRFKKNKL